MTGAVEHERGWLKDDPLRDLNALKLERLARGSPLVDLSMINPDLAPPRFLLDKLLEATVKAQNHRYAVSRGIRKLREAFVTKYGRRFGVELDPEREVCVTLGTKDALVSVLRCLGSAGDSVAVAEPTYPAHISAIELAGLEPRLFELGSDDGETARDLARVLRQSGARVVLLNLPNNPTGKFLSPLALESVCRCARDFGAIVVNDFVYGEMVYGGARAPSVLSVPSGKGSTVEVYSLSKAYSVPGWRVGALVGPAEIVHQVSRLKSHSDYGVFLPLQIAAAAGLAVSDDLVSPLTRQYEYRARVLGEGLKRLGWSVESPQAGASVWAEIPERGRSVGSSVYVRHLIEEAGVFAVPGLVFGQRWDRFVRFALVHGEERLREALQRMGESRL